MSTIGDLCVTSSVNPDDMLPVWKTSDGVTRRLPVSVFDSRYLTQADIALLAASPVTETFVAGTDFTPGVSIALTLKNQYFSASNIEVFFDAAYQGPDQYSLIGFGLTFTSAIPEGVERVYVRGGESRMVGAPSDGTVTDASIAAGSSLSNRIKEVVYVKDPQFGALGNGVANDTAAIQAALSSGVTTVVVPDGTYLVKSQLSIPAHCTLALSSGATLKAGANTNIVRIHASGRLTGGTIDCTFPGFSSVGIEINGDDQSSADPFLLSSKTVFDNVRLYGNIGTGNGIAISVHADGVANARVMGVVGRAKIWGFNTGLYLGQSSTDGSKFITSNEFDIMCDETVLVVNMDSATPNGYNIDGNKIRATVQPWSSTTLAAYTLCGQLNEFDLYAWDWYTVAGAAPFALIMLQGMRNNKINTWIAPGYIDDNSQTSQNFIINYGEPSITIQEIRAPGAVGSNLIFDTSNSGGSHIFRTNGVNQLYINSNGNMQAIQAIFPASSPGNTQNSCGLWGGTGAPASGTGNNGDIYLRSDGGTGTTIYQKRAGAWTGIL